MNCQQLCRTTFLSLRQLKLNLCSPVLYNSRLESTKSGPEDGEKKQNESACSKTEELAKKLRAKTPIGKLEELEVGKHPYQEKEPLEAWPDNTNPHTGEIGGPRGPEPTRYGDWERKGRVTDF